MPERGFDTSFWTDPFVRRLSPHAKLLFTYLWTNDHCNQAGAYEIDLETMAFETKLPEAELSALITDLSPKVEWFHEQDIIWVKNFLVHQAKSPKFLIAAAKCLKKLNNNGISAAVVAYNAERHSISIPYQYHIDSVPILPVSTTTTVSVSKSKSNSSSGKEIGVVKGEGEVGVVSRLYEENISQLTPIISEKLKDIVESYPAGWFQEALKEALGAGVRKLSYIEAILGRWQREGIKSSRKGTAPTPGEYGNAVCMTQEDVNRVKKIRQER
ncbi:MAG: DnaD domain protein [Deltaproteobacteria bacterium]|nr:DnaD domain protein [Deltaproteobacteria bacterium]